MTTDTPVTSRFSLTPALGSILLLLLCVAVYGQVVGFGFINYDDPAFITGNAYVSEGLDSTNLRWAFAYEELGKRLTDPAAKNLWHPLTWISYMIDAQIWGPSSLAKGIHLTNLVLHGIASVLCFLLFTQISGRLGFAFIVAALFCIHPLHVECVSWSAQRKDVLSAVFFFGALIAYLRAAEGSGSLVSHIPAILLTACALLAKSSTVVLPVLMVLLDRWPLQRNHLVKEPFAWKAIIISQLKEKWPYFLLAGLTSLIGIYFQYRGTVSGLVFAYPLHLRLLDSPAHIAFYLQRTFVPVNLTLDYPPPSSVSFLWIYRAAGIALLVLISRKAWDLRKSHPVFLFGWGWFLVCLIPVSGLAYVGTSFTSDRYTYLGHCGLFLALAAWASHAARDRKLEKWLPFLTAGIILISGILAFIQCGKWKNSETAFSHATVAQPRSNAAWGLLGTHYVDLDQDEKAIGAYRNAIKNNKLSFKSWLNLGYALVRVGKPDEAMEAFQKSADAYPQFVPALNQVGAGNELKGNLAEAEDAYRRAWVASKHKNPVARQGLVRILTKLGRDQEAQEVTAHPP